MDSNLMECDLAERDAGLCGCTSCAGPTLAVLKEVQRAYEERMEAVDKMSGNTKLQTQVKVLRSWVGDLVGQNTLLARAVEELEAEATTQLFRERRRHSEVVMELRAELAALRRRLACKSSDLQSLLEVLRCVRECDVHSLKGIHFEEIRKSDIYGSIESVLKTEAQGDAHSSREKKTPCGNMSDLKIINESLYKENIAKDREIRKLNKDVQLYEQTIMSLRNEVSIAKYRTPDVSTNDAEVMVGLCCAGAECGDWEPVQDFSAALRDELVSYRERIHQVEGNLKSSCSDVKALRSANVFLQLEVHKLRSACAALAQECQAIAVRDSFKEDIIREMRRQLKQAKAQFKEVAEVVSRSGSMKSHDSCREWPRPGCEKSHDSCREWPRPGCEKSHDSCRESPRPDFVKSHDSCRESPRPGCVRAQPRRAPDQPRRLHDDVAPLSHSDDCRSPRLVRSTDNLLSAMPD